MCTQIKKAFVKISPIKGFYGIHAYLPVNTCLLDGWLNPAHQLVLFFLKNAF
jgi:hypothetical protein